MNHQIPAMIIAMVEAGGLAIQHGGDIREGFSQLTDSCGIDSCSGPLLQTVLDKMLELPHVELKVKALLEGDAGIVAVLDAANLKLQQFVDGLLIPSDDLGIRQALDAVPQRGIAQVFEQENAFI